MDRRGLVVAAFSVLFSLSSCGPNMTDRYDWVPTENAPRGFPMRVLRGELVLSDQTVARLVAGMNINNGWGATGQKALIGDRLKAIPKQLNIVWFSFAENKFFKSSLTLPSEKISNLFAEGFTSPSNGNHRTYETINVGLAPGGIVGVWVAGEGQVREITHDTGTETTVDWKTVVDNPDQSRQAYIDLVMTNTLGAVAYSEFLKAPVESEFWKRAAKLYELTPSVLVPDNQERIYISYVNGERELLSAADSGKVASRNRAAPKKIEAMWVGADQLRRSATIELDETESLAAVEKLTATDPSNPLTFVVDLTLAPVSVKVSLRDKQFLLPLNKVSSQFRSE